MPENLNAFSQSYAEARRKFLQQAADAGLRATSHPHPLPGSDGEALAMDVVRDGPPDAQLVLMVSSACHGAEGYCGSGVQVSLLANESWRRLARDAGVAVVHVHALNPHGFSWTRRVTHEGVDLNRNFHDFSAPLPRNEAYARVHPWLIPDTWPPSPSVQAAIQDHVARHGLAAFQAAVSGGQYEFPGGLFYGGTAPTWSNRTLRHVLRAECARARRLAWVDVHTGLGPCGVGERIHAGRDDRQEIERTRRWWGEHVTTLFDGTSTSAPLTGLMCNAAYEECPGVEYTGIALEYGTVPIEQVVDALRADHWLHAHPEAPPSQRALIVRQMRDTFYVDTPQWKLDVLRQAHEVMQQAVRGLAEA